MGRPEIFIEKQAVKKFDGLIYKSEPVNGCITGSD